MEESAITLYVKVAPALYERFVDWQAKLNAMIVGSPHFVSLEFLVPTQTQSTWVIAQRFRDSVSASHWRQSPSYIGLIRELRQMSIDHEVQEVDGDPTTPSGVTEVIVVHVTPDREEEYREWSGRMHQAEARFPGFKSVYVQSPTMSQGDNWITLLQFDTPEHLDNWLNSSERRKILEDSRHLIASLETHRVTSSYAGWFSSLSTKGGALPSVWKQTMVVLLVLFPVVMLEIQYLLPLIRGLGPTLTTFIGNALSVTLIAFPLMPVAIYCLRWWLSPHEGPHYRQKTILGVLLLFFLYLIEIVIFWDVGK